MTSESTIARGDEQRHHVGDGEDKRGLGNEHLSQLELRGSNNEAPVQIPVPITLKSQLGSPVSKPCSPRRVVPSGGIAKVD